MGERFLVSLSAMGSFVTAGRCVPEALEYGWPWWAVALTTAGALGWVLIGVTTWRAAGRLQ